MSVSSILVTAASDTLARIAPIITSILIVFGALLAFAVSRFGFKVLIDVFTEPRDKVIRRRRYYDDGTYDYVTYRRRKD